MTGSRSHALLNFIILQEEGQLQSSTISDSNDVSSTIGGGSSSNSFSSGVVEEAVSYTHLTLPTILLV